MENQDVSRRTLLKGGGAALAELTVLRVAGLAQAFGDPGDEVIPWLDQPAPNPIPENVGNLLKWEALDSWRIPTNNFFFVNHYGQPAGLDESTWRVGIAGLVAHPQSLTLADLKARERREVDFTLECSGNTGTGLDFFIGGIGNARWGGAQLAPLLEEAGVLEQGTEVVFYGSDSGKVTIRDNSGIVSGGKTGVVEPDSEGGLDLTITEQFARSMSIDEALNRDNLLCYEMNGEPLPRSNGFPVRLIAPGWYGVANVKWLKRIEVLDHRYAGRFMARDYVSIREEQRDGQTVWTFTTVSHDRLKSAPAKVTRRKIDTPSWAPPGARRSRRWRSKLTMGPGWRRGSSVSPRRSRRWTAKSRTGRRRRRTSRAPRHTGEEDRVATAGSSGRSTGGRPARASTGFGRGRSTSTATSSQRRTIHSSPAGGPTGRATGR